MSLLLALTGAAGGNSQALAITLDSVTVAINQTAGHSQALAATLDGVTVSVSQTAGHPQSLAITLDGVTALINQSVAGASNSQALAITLDDVSIAIQQAGPVLATTGGGVPWNPYRATGETEAQKETRRIAQGIIQRAKQPQADMPALFEEAREVSAEIKADIAQIELDIQGLLALIDKRQTKLRLDALRKSQNDVLAMRQMEAALIDLQLRAEAQAQQIEELDVVFMVIMLAAL